MVRNFAAIFPASRSKLTSAKATKASNTPRLNIIIAGAGLGGIAAAISCVLSGHSVTVLESAKELAEIGAGLQITPNASRLLRQWNLPQSLWDSGAEPTVITVHRYSGEVLAHEESFKEKINAKYGAPFIDLHRADLQQALYARATELGVKFYLNERVSSVDFAGPIVTTTSGRQYDGDLVVAADGLWSKCRECFLGTKDKPWPTGDLAYRIVLSVDQIKDEKLRSWIENPQYHFWIGPGSHVVGYSVRAGAMFNLVLLVPDTLPPGVSKQSGSVEEMRGLFEGWDPILTSFLSCVNTVDKWKLMHRAEMLRWVNNAHNFVLIGDSCHPMLPYLAQGANSSLEDGAVLGAFLGKITSRSQLPQALQMYESLRKARGESIARETFKQRHDFHMSDGPEQMARDEIFKSQLGKELVGAFPSRWTCPEVQPWLYGYDAMKEVEAAVLQHPFTPGPVSPSKSVGEFRRYLPDTTQPRFAIMRTQNAHEYARDFKDKRQPPWLHALYEHWRKLLLEPFRGVTSDGVIRPGLFQLQEEGVPIDFIVTRTEAVLSKLSAEQHAVVSYYIDSPEWRTWSNPEFLLSDKGLRLDQLNEDLRNAILDVLHATLSPEGYQKAIGAMKINHFLGQLVNCSAVVNEYSYNFVLFGTPSSIRPSGFSFYGHHLCLNIFFYHTQIVISPWFTGAEPTEIDDGSDNGTRILQAEERLGLKLMQSLPPSAQEEAQIYKEMHDPAMPPGRWNRDDQRHLCGACRDNRVMPYEGISVASFTHDQQDIVSAIFEQYLLYLPEMSRRMKLQQIQSFYPDTYFSWIGGFGDSDPFYYRLQSPVIIIEFDHHSGVFLTNELPAKFHIHTILRTPNAGDYGYALRPLIPSVEDLFIAPT